VDYFKFFRDEYLTGEDLLCFATSLRLCQTELGINSCWCIKQINHPFLKYFTTSHPSRPLFKGRDARLLSLALINQYAPDTESNLVVRYSFCRSQHCINPTHYFFGTVQDVWMQNAKRKGRDINPEIVESIKNQRESDKNEWTYDKLSKQYKLPYHVIRRICNEGAYTNG
jgi:hypothetical protein